VSSPAHDEIPPPESLVVPFDASKPSVARMYDYYLGGEESFPIDRAAAQRVMQRVPTAAPGLRANRRCMARMVDHLAGQGVDQFIDLGSGLPTQNPVHEVARRNNPAARIAYVDNDAVALGHSRALLGHTPGIGVVRGDIRRPRRIIDAPDMRALIDFDRPVAVLFIAVLHFITDAEDPGRIVRVVRDATPPGSCLAITIATTDGPDPEEIAEIQRVYADASAPGVFRPREQIADLFDGYDLMDPGLVRIPDWRPVNERTCQAEREGAEFFLAGVGRKSA